LKRADLVYGGVHIDRNCISLARSSGTPTRAAASYILS
jgi:ethanolamine ammonia-lyase small subunit